MASVAEHIAMISLAAEAMGPELCREVTFVGGCTTALLLTDRYAMTQVRHTDDVDLIVSVIGIAGWYALVSTLREKGFREQLTTEDGPVCAMTLGSLRVDFMPDDESVLGFGNYWYKAAAQNATFHKLTAQLIIRLVTSVYFVATKLEAYLHRGNHDPIESRDIEDILTLIDGRPELLQEILDSTDELKKYFSEQFSLLLKHGDFAYAIQSAAGDGSRQALVEEKIKTIISYARPDK